MDFSSCSSVQKVYAAASSSFMPSGRLPSAMAAIVAASTPAFAASWEWACHSYCALQYRAVMRIASSLIGAGSELPKRMYSPSFCARSASSGLRSSALNGPRSPPRGPAAIASATRRCSGVISSAESVLKRGGSAVCATHGATIRLKTIIEQTRSMVTSLLKNLRSSSRARRALPQPRLHVGVLKDVAVHDVARRLAARVGGHRGEGRAGDAAEALVGPAQRVRRDDDVVELEERVVGGRRLLLEDVDRGAGDGPVDERPMQRLLVDDRAARRVDEIGGGLHQRELARADQLARRLVEVARDTDEVRLAQQRLEV